MVGEIVLGLGKREVIRCFRFSPYLGGRTLLQSRELAWRRIPVKPPSLRSILLGLIPFAATCFSVALWDRVYPMVFGLPFNFFWLILWLLLTPVCMWVHIGKKHQAT
jgi:hypothetical protein